MVLPIVHYVTINESQSSSHIHIRTIHHSYSNRLIHLKLLKLLISRLIRTTNSLQLKGLSHRIQSKLQDTYQYHLHNIPSSIIYHKYERVCVDIVLFMLKYHAMRSLVGVFVGHVLITNLIHLNHSIHSLDKVLVYQL